MGRDRTQDSISPSSKKPRYNEIPTKQILAPVSPNTPARPSLNIKKPTTPLISSFEEVVSLPSNNNTLKGAPDPSLHQTAAFRDPAASRSHTT